MSEKITSLHPQKPKATGCLICGEKATSPNIPFCSRRCSQVDLGNWLNEAYVIPAHEADEDGDLDAIIAEVDKDTPLS